MIVLAIALVVYNAAAFLIPFERGSVFWLTYVFTLISFAVAAFAVYKGLLAPKGAKSKFYGFPIARLGLIYLVAQVFGGLYVMYAYRWVPSWLAALIYIIALGATAVGLIGADAVVEEIGRQDTQLKKSVYVMRDLQSKLNMLVSQCEDGDAAKAIRDFAEELRYSDPVTSGTEELETELAALIDELQKAVTDADTKSARQLCQKATAVLAERNRLCKLNKGK